MAIRKHIINGIEYNLLTNEELEEILFVSSLEMKGNELRKDIDNNYMTIEEFKRKGDELFGL